MNASDKGFHAHVLFFFFRFYPNRRLVVHGHSGVAIRPGFPGNLEIPVSRQSVSEHCVVPVSKSSNVPEYRPRTSDVYPVIILKKN